MQLVFGTKCFYTILRVDNARRKKYDDPGPAVATKNSQLPLHASGFAISKMERYSTSSAYYECEGTSSEPPKSKAMYTCLEWGIMWFVYGFFAETS